MKILRRYWRYAVSAIALGLLVAVVGAGRLVSIALDADPVLFSLYVVGFSLVPLAFAVQVRHSLHLLGHDLDRVRVLRASVSAWSIGLLTPARAGDLSLAGFLRPDVPGSDSGAVVVVDKLLSVAALGCAAVLGASTLNSEAAAPLAVTGILMVLAVLAILAASATERVRMLLSAVTPKRMDRFVQQALQSMSRSLRVPNYLSFTVAAVVVRWVGLFLLNLVLFRSLGADPSPMVVVAATSLGRLVALIPIAIGGVGVKEPLQIAIYESAGVPGEVVVAASVLGLAVNYSVAALLPLLVGRRQIKVVAEQ